MEIIQQRLKNMQIDYCKTEHVHEKEQQNNTFSLVSNYTIYPVFQTT